jgi:hypothetical protein
VYKNDRRNVQGYWKDADDLFLPQVEQELAHHYPLM